MLMRAEASNPFVSEANAGEPRRALASSIASASVGSRDPPPQTEVNDVCFKAADEQAGRGGKPILIRFPSGRIAAYGNVHL